MVILIDEPPSKKDFVIKLSPPSKKRKVTKTSPPPPVAVPTGPVPPPPTVSDTSGALIIDGKWKTPWYYRNHHVRVSMTSNDDFKLYTTFVNSKIAAGKCRPIDPSM